MEEKLYFKRESLVDILGVKLPIETPKSRELSIRVGVDKELAKLFGANLLLRFDFSSRPIYTLQEIGDILNQYEISIPADKFVEVKLKTSLQNGCNDHYYFVKYLDSKGDSIYSMQFHHDSKWDFNRQYK